MNSEYDREFLRGGTERLVTTAALVAKAAEIRAAILTMLSRARSGHTAGSLSLVDILTALYFGEMVHNPKDPDWPDRDVLFLSNGHTAPALYATLAFAGYLPTSELPTLRQLGSRLQGHPERVKLPGLESTSGPLGEGLSQAAGYAFAAQRLDHATHRFVYAVLSDGELDEGNPWEAAMFASKYRLGRLIAIVDRNFIQIDGSTEDVMPLGDLAAKWRAFGWHVQEIDGNDVEAVIKAVRLARRITDSPSVIVAYTVPSRGVPWLEYDYTWHGKVPSEREAADAIAALSSEGLAL